MILSVFITVISGHDKPQPPGCLLEQQFAKKLKKCSENPHIPSAKLRGLKDCYKIKLRASGFRLVYQVIDDMLIIAVVAVGKRERSHVYNLASERMR
ncbi:type II toxin-antitoxin system RelE family toxin [Escherichia coli]|uniref:type II toxin-antitoxin system RelE family toxin n=3 Tax=Escherichia coli TaxID=562 RepID=UPI000DF61CDE|nr:toxin of the RelE-RelB toxin-antitoxin system [Escherichia coli]